MTEENRSPPWNPLWVWLWVIVAVGLIVLAFFVKFRIWALVTFIGFGSLETIGLLAPSDAFPPLTHVIVKYIPREIALLLMCGFTGAAAAAWLGFAHPVWIGITFAFVGWVTAHFDIAYDETRRDDIRRLRALGGRLRQFLPGGSGGDGD